MYITDVLKLCMKYFGAGSLFDKIIAFKFSQCSDHCSAYLVSTVFHFFLEDRTIILNVTVPCHCLSFILFDLILVSFFYFGQLKL